MKNILCFFKIDNKISPEKFSYDLSKSTKEHNAQFGHLFQNEWSKIPQIVPFHSQNSIFFILTKIHFD